MFIDEMKRWADDLQYRQNQLGWFISGMLFFVSVHLVLLLGFLGITVGILPFYFGLFLLALSYISVSVLFYTASRLIAPAKDALSSKRRIIVVSLILGAFLIQLFGFTAYNIIGVSREALRPIALPFGILLYLTAIAVGYDAARTKNGIERLKSKQTTIYKSHPKTQDESDPLIDVFQGKSEKKALLAGIGCLVIGGVIALFSTPIAGLSSAGSIAGILAFIYELYPDE